MTATGRGAVSQWYSGKNVLITGATGFVGKVMVEKLLRSCPEVSSIYLLVREKKNRSPLERLDDFIDAPVFDKLREQRCGEELFKKLHCVPGDVTLNDLGLHPDDARMLGENVHVVFHVAANVRFDQPLKPMLLINTKGTINVLDLACRMERLKAFVHVSTSYCQCDVTTLEEKSYQTTHDPRKVVDLIEWMDDDLMDSLTPNLLKNSPNTYAYTKCLAEQLVTEYASKIPVLIARPSTVLATWKEPFAGWVDNLHGPTGLLVAAGKGVIRTLHCDPKFEADVVPVDVTVNSLIVLAWKRANSPDNPKTLVYNITANKDNRISWGVALKSAKRHFFDNPFSVCLWYPGGGIKSSYIVHMVCVLLFHFIPAYLIDFLMIVTRNRPFLVRTQKRIQNGLKLLQYYTTRPWCFRNEKFSALWEGLGEEDKRVFYSDKYLKNWDDYMLAYILGTRQYCVHESPDTIPHARKVLKRLYYLDLGKNVLLIALFLWLFSSYVSMVFEKIEPLLESAFAGARNTT